MKIHQVVFLKSLLEGQTNKQTSIRFGYSVLISGLVYGRRFIHTCFDKRGTTNKEG